MRARHPAAEVVGCTTAGEFAAGRHGEGGASAFGFAAGAVVRAAGYRSVIDLADRLRDDGTLDRLRDGSVEDAYAGLRDQLRRVGSEMG